MLYNLKKDKVQTMVDCQTCPYFDKKKKKCGGFGQYCFEYDDKTGTIIDPVTKLPLKVEQVRKKIQ